MAEPILANSIVNLFTDIGRLPCHKPHSSMSGSGSGSGGRKRSLIIGKAQRQRSFFEDYWAEDEEVCTVHSNFVHGVHQSLCMVLDGHM